MSAASRGSDPDGSFRAVSEQIVSDQDIFGGVSAMLCAGLDTAVAVFYCVIDEINVLCPVRVNSEAGIVHTVAVGDRVAEDQPASGVVDTRRRVSIVAGKADGDVAGVVESVSDDIDICHIGRDGNRFRPPCLTVFNGVAEEKNIGNGVSAPSHHQYGIGAMIFAFGAGS